MNRPEFCWRLHAGPTTQEVDRIKALQRENRERRQANEILRKASAYSAGGARPPVQTMVAFMTINAGRMGSSPRRYEITDFEWSIIVPLLPNKPRGVPRVDDRRVLNGIFWRLRTGSPWADIPERYGPPTTCYNRFVRWRKLGVWDRLFEAVSRAYDGDLQIHRLAPEEPLEFSHAFLEPPHVCGGHDIVVGADGFVAAFGHQPPPSKHQARRKPVTASNVADRHARLHRLCDDGQFLLGGEASAPGDAGDDFDP